MKTDVIDARPAAIHAAAGKYLTFLLGAESYGIPVVKVREIIRPISITVMPQMPAQVKGVINLRGRIVPIVDLRVKFNLATAAMDGRTCIVVVQVEATSGTKTHVGLIVDAVEEVLNLTPAEMEPVPDFGAKLDTEHIVAMAKVKDRVKTLLNIDRLLESISTEAMASLSDAQASRSR